MLTRRITHSRRDAANWRGQRDGMVTISEGKAARLSLGVTVESRIRLQISPVHHGL